VGEKRKERKESRVVWKNKEQRTTKEEMKLKSKALMRSVTPTSTENHEERRILASDLKAASESLRRIFCFIDPTARWHRIICSSMGNLLAMAKKRVAAVAA